MLLIGRIEKFSENSRHVFPAALWRIFHTNVVRRQAGVHYLVTIKQ